MHVANKIKDFISFSYPYAAQTQTPSKQTATQLKGREKDAEAAENTRTAATGFRLLKKPAFAESGLTATEYGNAMHTVMQYIAFENCESVQSVQKELDRLVEQGYLSGEQASAVNAEQIAAFFSTEIGQRLLSNRNVLREFKFSVLVQDAQCPSDDPEDQILLQGVVDCAMISEDGIQIIDFKTDAVDQDYEYVAEKYRIQLTVYAEALAKIYDMPVTNAWLYFFKINKFISIM